MEIIEIIIAIILCGVIPIGLTVIIFMLGLKLINKGFSKKKGKKNSKRNTPE